MEEERRESSTRGRHLEGKGGRHGGRGGGGMQSAKQKKSAPKAAIAK